LPLTHVATREVNQELAEELFEVVMSGRVKIRIDPRFALKDVREAQVALEARKTTGCTVLLPQRVRGLIVGDVASCTGQAARTMSSGSRGRPCRMDACDNTGRRRRTAAQR
jgi:hypothetical protein